VSGPPLVDSHCHVGESAFDDDRDAVLARAAAVGVATIVCVGATGPVATNAPALALAGERGGVRVAVSVGIHPHDASSADDAALATLAGMTAAPGVVAVGETGLDYYYEHSPRDAQRAAFAATIALARKVGLPLVVHVRDAHREAAEILARDGADAGGGVIHCFTGTWDEARPYLDLGFHISVAGIVTFRNAEPLRDAVRNIPLDRLLVETDSPFLAPIPHRGRRNEPAHVRVVAEAVAQTRSEPFEKVAEATTANALRLFRLT
jgi:TatD DNase family protein